MSVNGVGGFKFQLLLLNSYLHKLRVFVKEVDRNVF